MSPVIIWSSGCASDRQAHPLWNLLSQHWDRLKRDPQMQVELSIALRDFGANRLDAAHCDSYGHLIVRADSDMIIETVLGEWPYLVSLKEATAAKAPAAVAAG